VRIGIAGTGRMGRAFAERLTECGRTVAVWNRTADKAQPLVDAGAARAASPAELVAMADAIITVVTDAAALDDIYGGADGLLSGSGGGKLFIEMSTVRPQTQIRLAGTVRSAGHAFVECAVSGSVGPARQGKLIGLIGGEAADVERARPVLDQLCRRVETIGPVGSGASAKLAVNLPLVVYFQALGEAYALCRHLGRDPAWLVDLLADTSGGPNILKARGAAFAEALGGGNPAPAFGVDAIVKDLRTMVEEGEGRGIGLPLTELTLDLFEDASASGWAGRDGTTLAAYWPDRVKAE
jgi:3-hydroxyisobutyrate dehydrogenase